MYKNQLQELAQRSCFNLPSYTSFREGPDHTPRFKAAVNFNGEMFESPSYCSTLRQAEHSAAVVALDALASRGPSNSLAARILDETGVYKNLLQEVSQRLGASLPAYTTFRTGQSHLPVFTCTVELVGIIFTGESAMNKKQAEKNAAMAAWLSIKTLVQQFEISTSERSHKNEQEHVIAARAMQKYLMQARLARISFPIKFPTPNPRPSSTQQSPVSTSKILPFICPKATPNRAVASVSNNSMFQKTVRTLRSPFISISNESNSSTVDNLKLRPQKFPSAGAAPYIPVRHCNPHLRIAPPVTMRNAIPVFSAPPLPSPPQSSMVMRPTSLGVVPPVCVKHAVPAYTAPPVQMEELPKVHPAVKIEDPQFFRPATTLVEGPTISRPAAGRLDESQFSKFPIVQVEEPIGSKLLPVCVAPDSEILAVQIQPPSSEVAIVQVKLPVSEVAAVQVVAPISEVNSPVASLKDVAENTRMLVHDKLQQLAGIEDFNELKI